MQVKENTNIVQSNFLLENRPKFTMDETRLFITIIGAVNKDDEDFSQLEIPVTEFASLWGVESNAAYRKIKAALRGLVQKEFFIEGVNPKTGKSRFLSMSYVSMATYEQGAGYATVEISQMFKPYLLALKKNYTKYVLRNILSLSTVNAIRNYELMKQYEGLGKRAFTIDEYKKLLCIEDKYSRNTDLRVNVIEPACKEISENTDIVVSYKMEGRGQKARIIFTIKPQKQTAPLPAGTNDNLPSRFPNGEGAPADIPNSVGSTGTEGAAHFATHSDLSAFEQDLMEAIPEEVHKGEPERVLAVLDIANRYIAPTDFMEFYQVDDNDTDAGRLQKAAQATRAAAEDRNDRILNAINTYTTRDYNIRRKNIQNPNAHFKYYLVGFEGWLLSHQY